MNRTIDGPGGSKKPVAGTAPGGSPAGEDGAGLPPTANGHRSAERRCVLGRSADRQRLDDQTCPICPPGGARRLTAQEATIARMLVEGLTERQIAAEVFVGAVALRAHLAHICAKLDVPRPGDLATVVGCGTRLEFAPGQANVASACPTPVSRSQLTPQEKAVDQLLRDGRGERQVAAELSIGIAAVRSHIAHIQEKLGADEPIRH